jgi:hypothetical protein
MSKQSLHSCSETFSRVIAEAAVDVLGYADAAWLVENPSREVKIDALVASLEDRFGSDGGKGVAQRMGRAAFKYFLDHYGSDLQLTSMDYRLMRVNKRIKSGLEAVSRKLGKECGAEIKLVADEGAYYWQIQWECDPADVKNDFSYFLAGMAQELMSWSGGGRFYNVRELPDEAACMLKMDQKPLD